MASFEKRGDKFRAVVSYKNAQGLRKKESKTFDKKKDAAKWAADLETKLNNGYDASASKQTLPDYFDEWVRIYKIGSVRETTKRNYIRWGLIIRELFGDVPMSKLTTPLLQKELDLFGKDHAPGYMANITSALKASLKDAHIDGVITKDIYTRLVNRGNTEQERNDKNYLDATEFQKLQSYLYDHTDMFVEEPRLLMILISLETGARIGEILGLNLSDVDVKRSLINIDKSFATVLNEVTETKNKYSVRSVSISDDLTNVLADYIATRDSDALFAKRSYLRMSEFMKEFTVELDLTPITFHGLRHSHVSYLLHNDVAVEYISKRVGHKDTSVTLSTYAHMLKEKEDTQNDLALAALNFRQQKKD